MRRNWILGIFAALLLALVLMAQHTGTTVLAVRVDPESTWTPGHSTLIFHVSSDGASDLTSQPQPIQAWVRTVPGQTIHLTASATLSGPSGTVPLSNLRWRGMASGATGGGKQANCTTGSFAGGPTQELVAAWNRSGTLNCTVTFSLAEPRALPRGTYTALLDFAIR